MISKKEKIKKKLLRVEKEQLKELILSCLLFIIAYYS